MTDKNTRDEVPRAVQACHERLNAALTAAGQVHLAVKQGYADAQTALGWMYQNGRGGLRKDKAEAVKWYRKAAAQENTTAQDNLHQLGD